MIIALTEASFPLAGAALGRYLLADFRREQMRNYETELVYLLVKRHYSGVKSPREFREIITAPKKAEPTADEIRANVLRKLRGE